MMNREKNLIELTLPAVSKDKDKMKLNLRIFGKIYLVGHTTAF